MRGKVRCGPESRPAASLKRRGFRRETVSGSEGGFLEARKETHGPGRHEARAPGPREWVQGRTPWIGPAPVTRLPQARGPQMVRLGGRVHRSGPTGTASVRCGRTSAAFALLRWALQERLALRVGANRGRQGNLEQPAQPTPAYPSEAVLLAGTGSGVTRAESVSAGSGPSPQPRPPCVLAPLPVATFRPEGLLPILTWHRCPGTVPRRVDGDNRSPRRIVALGRGGPWMGLTAAALNLADWHWRQFADGVLRSRSTATHRWSRSCM